MKKLSQSWLSHFKRKPNGKTNIEKRNSLLLRKQVHCLAGIGRTECKIIVTFQEQEYPD